VVLETGASPAPTGGTVPTTAEAAAAARMAQTGATPTGRVYYGSRPVERGAEGHVRQEDQYLSTEDAFMDFYKWDDKQRRDLIAQGVLSGQLPKGADITQASAWWQRLVNEAANFASVGAKVSPMDIAAGAVDAAGQQFGMPKTVTTSRTATNISDPMTAKAMTTNAFRQMLGRDPAPGEIGSFAAALQQAEQAAPSTETTTSTYNPEGYLTNESKQTQGGITAEGEKQLLEDKLKATSEYGVQQAATTFADATHRAIWGQPG